MGKRIISTGQNRLRKDVCPIIKDNDSKFGTTKSFYLFIYLFRGE